MATRPARPTPSVPRGDGAPSPLDALEAEITACRRCPRLVEWRERVAREKRAAFADQEYWGRPVPGFGDPAARVYLLGLAPAAHGANRTGRMFTGDRSGDWLFAALHRTGFANQPTARHRDDGLRLRDCWVTATVRCAPPANRPLPAERDNCLPYAARELELMPRVRVIVCLGGFAWDAALRLLRARGAAIPRPRPRFGHGAELPATPSSVAADPTAPAASADTSADTSAGRAVPASTPTAPALLGCFHPSQQNTFTGRLTEPMIDAVLLRARELAELPPVSAA